jgi:hypothetical protein
MSGCWSSSSSPLRRGPGPGLLGMSGKWMDMRPSRSPIDGSYTRSRSFSASNFLEFSYVCSGTGPGRY